MSNKKKLEDILKTKEASPVNLSGEPILDENKKRTSPKLGKEENNYSKIRDIYSEKSEEKGIYLLTTPQKTYRLIPNLLKILIAGSLILLLINRTVAFNTIMNALACERFLVLYS